MGPIGLVLHDGCEVLTSSVCFVENRLRSNASYLSRLLALSWTKIIISATARIFSLTERRRKKILSWFSALGGDPPLTGPRNEYLLLVPIGNVNPGTGTRPGVSLDLSTLVLLAALLPEPGR